MGSGCQARLAVGAADVCGMQVRGPRWLAGPLKRLLVHTLLAGAQRRHCHEYSWLKFRARGFKIGSSLVCVGLAEMENAPVRDARQRLERTLWAWAQQRVLWGIEVASKWA